MRESSESSEVNDDVINSKIIAVVVTFHPDESIVKNVNSVLLHADAVLVVDNTPGETPEPVDRLGKILGVRVHRYGTNRGVGTALNLGRSEAVTGGYEWLLTLDQDSVLRSGWAKAVQEVFDEGGATTAVVGVRFRNTASGGLDSPETGGENVSRVITSGSAWSVPALTAVGPFREDLFVDGIDNEMCFRLRSAGYRVRQSRRVVMDHEMGHTRQVRSLGRTVNVIVYSKTRYYYIFRSAVELARRYGTRERGWIREESRWLGQLLSSAVRDREPARLGAAARGIWDGLRGRFGPAPAAVESREANP